MVLPMWYRQQNYPKARIRKSIFYLFYTIRIWKTINWQHRVSYFFAMGEFLEMLSPEARERLEAINDLKSDLSVMANEDYFLYGFRLGARMILDIIGDYKGQFCSPDEAG